MRHYDVRVLGDCGVDSAALDWIEAPECSPDQRSHGRAPNRDAADLHCGVHQQYRLRDHLHGRGLGLKQELVFSGDDDLKPCAAVGPATR